MREPIDLKIYNQYLYKGIPTGNSKNAGNVWCLICSLAMLYSRLFNISISPQTMNMLLRMHSGFRERSNLVVWDRNGVKPLETIFPDAKLDIHLWNKNNGHLSEEKIVTPSIISVDGLMTTREYDSHFLFAYMRYGLNGKPNIYAFDPYIGKYISVLDYYNKGSLKDSIYSVINIKKTDSDIF